MDKDLEHKINEAVKYIESISDDSIRNQLTDPVARMMLVALLHESQKIQDYLDGMGQKITERFCEDFIPRREVNAMPAIALVAPDFRHRRNSEIVSVGSDALFSFKTRVASSEIALNYRPLLEVTAVPYDCVYLLTKNKLSYKDKVTDISMDKPNRIYIGINTKADLRSLKGISFFIKGISHVHPEHISVVNTETYELSFCTMNRMENMGMAEPFDAQQLSGQFTSIVQHWKQQLLDMEDGTLLGINDEIEDRDVVKAIKFPKVFQSWLESEVLDCFYDGTFWLQVDYPEGFVVPDNCKVILNTVPVVNVDVCSLTLTQNKPIQKLNQHAGSFFIQVLETSNQSHGRGFGMSSEEFVIRDFDAACYNNGDLYREVRNLYNHFVEDYYAFIEYNELKDGEAIKKLMGLINKIGNGVASNNRECNFDSGTYAMRNINQPLPSSRTQVSYLTTYGKLGNILLNSDEIFLENKSLPAFEKRMNIVVPAMGGRNKATADERYEQLRYYSLTNDRLYTKMDIDAFVRKELLLRFGNENFKRIFIKINVGGSAGVKYIRRGLYIDIEFKDKVNYQNAKNEAFDIKLRQQIENKSCISIPIIVNLINVDIS